MLGPSLRMQKKIRVPPPPPGNDTCARGVPARACSPGKFLKKRCYLVHSERSKIINLKINNFRDNKSTTTKKYSAYFVFYQTRCACK